MITLALVMAHGSAGASEWLLQQWTVDDGLPINSVTDLVQDADGFIWLTTLDGLVRFDGLSFRVVDGAPEQLPSNRFTSLRADTDGTLWLSTEQNHLVRYRNGAFLYIEGIAGMPDLRVVRVAQSPDGRLAYGARNGIVVIKQGEVHAVGAPWAFGEIQALHWVGDDQLLAAVDGLLLQLNVYDGDSWAAPRIKSYPLPGRAWALEDGGSTIWIGTDDGLYALDEGSEALRRLDVAVDPPVIKLSETGRGALLAVAQSLWRIGIDETATRLGSVSRNAMDAPLVTALDQDQELVNYGNRLMSGDRSVLEVQRDITSVLVDRDENLWLGTAGAGLYLARRSRIQVLTVEQGLAGENIYPVFGASDGSKWLGISGVGAVRLDAEDRLTATVDAVDPVWSIGEVDGDIWLAGEGLCVWDGVSECRNELPAEIADSAPHRLVFEDSYGRVWLGGRFGALWVRSPGRPWRRLGPEDGWTVDQPVRTVVEGPRGELWFGTNGSGVAHYRDDEFHILDTGSGLSSNLVRSLLLVPEGLLVGTENRGLCLIDSARRVTGCVDTDRGLATHDLHYMMVDAQQSFWWSSNRGVWYASFDEVLSALIDPSLEVSIQGHYNRRTGMRNAEANGGVYPAGWFDPRREQLWIPTQGGVVIIDPRRAGDVPDVRALIDRFRVLGDVRDRADRLQLGARERDVQVELTATSFHDPSNIEFRYRIGEGRWFYLGTNRIATLIDLPPGEISITFAARNRGGSWSSEPTRLALVVDRYWYEWPAVRISLLLMLAGIAFGLLRYRGQALRRRAEELQMLVDEQTEQLLDEARRRSDFFADISHELRTPLTLVLGPLEDAIDERRGLEGQNLQRVAGSARRMKRIVDQMLDLQKIDAKEMPVDPVPTNLADFFSACLEPFGYMANQLDIALRIDAEPVAAAIDVAQFEKVVANLMSNALKAAPGGTAIDVAVRMVDGMVRISVSDQGPGIPDAHAGKIFDRFFHQVSATRPDVSGTGIGLALVREIVRLHGGRVYLDQGSGESGSAVGARFVIELSPCSMEESENGGLDADASGTDGGSEPIPEPALDVDAEHVTVLIVEDNPDMRNYLHEALARHVQVIEACDGQQGLRSAQEHLPDVIVSDVMMPNMDGLQMLRRLRAHPETACIPLILLTARGSDNDSIDGFDAGADDYLAKPFRAPVLMARVKAILESRKRLARQLRAEEIPPQGSAEMTLADQLQAAVMGALDDPDFGVEQLAGRLNMSRSKLHRLATEELGASPSELMNQVRMAEAARLLVAGHPATAVSLAVGSPSLASFSRKFKSHFGVPPSRYAEQKRARCKGDLMTG